MSEQPPFGSAGVPDNRPTHPHHPPAQPGPFPPTHQANPAAPGFAYGPYAYGAPPSPPQPRRRRGAVTATALVSALAIAGGSYAVLSARGPAAPHATRAQVSPAAALLPDDTVGVLAVNLSPGSTETVAALKYLRKVTDEVQGDTLMDALFSMTNEEDGVDPIRDIKPWLGEHMAAGVVIRGAEPVPVISVQVTDAERAEASLELLREKTSSDDFGFVVDGDYVVFSTSTDAARDAVADAERDSLADNEQYGQDIASLPADSIIIGWIDARAMITMAKQAGIPNVDSVTNGFADRAAMAVRFEEDYLDVRVKQIGTSGIPGRPLGDRIGDLPDDTTVAVGASGLDRAIGQFDRRLRAYPGSPVAALTEELKRRTGLSFPTDLQALVGSRTIFTLGTANRPGMALVTSGGDPNKAVEVANNLPGQKVVVKRTWDGAILATSEEYATQVAQGGSLGDQDRFTKAIPYASTSSFVAYVDLDRLKQLDPADLDVGAATAFGVSVVYEGDTSMTYLRVVAD